MMLKTSMSGGKFTCAHLTPLGYDSVVIIVVVVTIITIIIIVVAVVVIIIMIVIIIIIIIIIMPSGALTLKEAYVRSVLPTMTTAS